MKIKISGMDFIDHQLGALDVEITRAARNAVDRTLRYGTRELVRAMAAHSGVPVEQVQARVRTTRTRENDASGEIIGTTRGTPLQLFRGFRVTADPKNPTRGTVLVDVPEATLPASGFVNPKGRKQSPLKRMPDGALRSLVGPSVGKMMNSTDMQPLVDELQEHLREQYISALKAQVLKR
jgi:hypothetical protein